jgi:hypothetical protein
MCIPDLLVLKMKPRTGPNTSKLRDEARQLLANRSVKITYKDIASATGVSLRWIENFAAGDIVNPGVCYVEAIKDFLTEQAQLV